MTKVGPKRDYPVGVRPYVWEESDNPAPYEGIFTMSLNVWMGVVFVPAMSGPAAQWDAGILPEDLGDVATPEQGRLSEALFASYVVTPNDSLAGQRERFTLPADWVGPEEDPADAGGVVWYVSGDEFAGFQRELDELSETCGGLNRGRPVSQLREGYAVVRFVEREIVHSGLLRPRDAHLLALDT